MTRQDNGKGDNRRRGGNGKGRYKAGFRDRRSEESLETTDYD